MSCPLCRSQECGRQTVNIKEEATEIKVEAPYSSSKGHIDPAAEERQASQNNCLLTGQQFNDIIKCVARKLVCHLCTATADNFVQLKQHLSKCSKLVCSKCHKMFTSDSLPLHMTTCSAFFCFQCPKRFISAETLQVHQKSKHYSSKCEFCLHNFVSDLECETHKTDNHFFQCEACNKVFGCSVNGMKYRFSKTASQKLLCSLCYESSQRPRPQPVIKTEPSIRNFEVETVNDHKKVKGNVGSSKVKSQGGSIKIVDVCSITEKASENENITANSFENQTDNVQFVCFYCEESFYKFNDLRDHLKTLHDTDLQELQHEGDLQNAEDALDRYESKIDSLFDTAIPLVDFENQAQYTCIVCDKMYKSLSTYCKHVFRAHKINNLLSSSKKYHCHECLTDRNSIREMNNHIYARHENLQHCEYCDMTFSNKKDKKFHLVSGHPEQPAFTCIDCNAKFHTHDELKKHCSWHWFQEVVECQLCNKKFKGKKKYKVHIHYHKIRDSEQGINFTCTECGKRLSSRSGLISHMRFAHRGGKHENVLCGECGILINARKYNRHHQRVHSKGRVYRCNSCSRAFFSKELLRQHSDTHIEGRPHECDQCPAAFKQLRNLRMHKRNYHSLPTTTCKLCDLEFETPAAFAEHRQNLHKRQLKFVKLESEEGYQCTLCPKVLKTSRAVASHTRIYHETHLHLTCNICSQRFPFSRQLQNHMSAHTEPKPSLTCTHCGRNFTTLGSLNSHIKWVHIGERNFPCSYCPARFKRKDAQIVHERTHTNERPYTCNVCQRQFRQRTDCKRHEAKHNLPGFRYNKPHKPRPRTFMTRNATTSEVVIEEVVQGENETEHDASDTLMLLEVPPHEDQQAAAYLSYIVQN